MPTFIYHMGQLIEKSARPVEINPAASDLPSPAVHSFAAYQSPINDATISSSRQRERDLHRSDSYDPRDTPASFKKAKNARRQANKRIAKSS